MAAAQSRIAVHAVVGVLLIGTCVAGAEGAKAQTAPRPSAPPMQPSADQSLIARGAYLAKAGDCAGCHTAVNGGAPYAGGLGMASPFGTIISSNITPDPRYGIGRYSYEDFARALREGVAPGAKHLYPAMPYPSFSKLADDDVHALYGYFMHAVKPVARPNEPPQVPFPFNQRWTLTFWKWLFMPKGGPYRAHPEHDAQWNRGAYLVQSLGHCGACHTPRGVAFQERGYDEASPHYLAGGVNDHWFAANLTGDPGSGLGRVPADDLVSFLKTGHGGGLVAYGSMVEQIEDSSQYLNDDDLRAIASYLKSLPSQQPSGNYNPERPVARSAANGNRVHERQSAGATVYQSFCARCHGDRGMGNLPLYPKLAGNPSVISDDATSLIRLLVEGGNTPATLTGPPRMNMPAFAGLLSDAEMAQALTYIRSAWGNDARQVTANDVGTFRSGLHK
ncbi:Alcohol dehydrogenase (quinone), cytochrome c subunit [Pararobbsia alpina]|uniref:Alcohol dehydrogenase (Quinone), cytochrome c subunit n=2 Tax=Pararobbsia alpina TaxID=621374 RepID=A0A6S7C103_9BURK|nr:Alcohol dehydrogenase (quinone), cytochrome c subunit [Pararobbsia alpina]